MADIVVPLLLRLANPPAVFVGREAERARLAASIGRAAVTVVWGFSGVGKSALVSSVLAEQSGNDARTVVVSAGAAGAGSLADGAAGGNDVAGAITRAFAHLPLAALSLSESDAPASAQRLVQALEEHGLWLVLDDVERVSGSPLLVATLALAQRSCRRARIVCVCREDPRQPALLAQTVAVGPMSLDELAALLKAVQPDVAAAEARALAMAARGSPWRLLQLSMGGAGDEGSAPEASLLALSPAAQGMLRTLSLVPVAVPLDVLGRAARLPPLDVVEGLARRGYLERSARGARLHSAARALVVVDDEEGSARAARLVTAIAACDDVDLALAALELLPRVDDAALLGWLDAWCRRLQAQGHAAALWRVVRTRAATTGGLFQHRARVAVDVGDEATALVQAPLNSNTSAGAAGGPEHARDAAAWAAVCLARNDRERAAAAAPGAARGGPAEQLVAAEVLWRSGDAARAATVLATVLEGAVDGVTGGDAVKRAALALLTGGKKSDDEAEDEEDDVGRLIAACDSLTADALRPVAALAAQALRRHGHVDDAQRLLARVPRSSATEADRAAERERGASQAAGPAWSVDEASMRVLLADGRSVALAEKKVLFDLLATLCRRGGAATKEQLLEAAWGVRDYHPLKHDNRLKVAVRKLRRLLEEELGDDPIEASDDGYRLRGRVRFIAK